MDEIQTQDDPEMPLMSLQVNAEGKRTMNYFKTVTLRFYNTSFNVRSYFYIDVTELSSK